MYTNLDDVYGKRQLSAEGVTLSGVRRGFPPGNTKPCTDITLERSI